MKLLLTIFIITSLICSCRHSIPPIDFKLEGIRIDTIYFKGTPRQETGLKLYISSSEDILKYSKSESGNAFLHCPLANNDLKNLDKGRDTFITTTTLSSKNYLSSAVSTSDNRWYHYEMKIFMVETKDNRSTSNTIANND